jgi:hypothetical protein
LPLEAVENSERPTGGEDEEYFSLSPLIGFSTLLKPSLSTLS